MKKLREIEIEIVPIMTPNFILTTGDDVLSISEFTEDELRELGREFTENLIKKSKQK